MAKATMEMTGVNDTFRMWKCKKCGAESVGSRHDGPPVCACEPVAPAPTDWRSRWQEKTRGGHELLGGVFQSSKDGTWAGVIELGGGDVRAGTWSEDGSWGCNPHHFDLLPRAPARVPMGRDDIAALGFVWVRSDHPEDTSLATIRWFDEQVVDLDYYGSTTPDELAKKYLYSKDGREWHPFTKEGA